MKISSRNEWVERILNTWKSAFVIIFISRMEQTRNLIIGSRAIRNHCYHDLTTLLWFIFHCLLTSNRDRRRKLSKMCKQAVDVCFARTKEVSPLSRYAFKLSLFKSFSSLKLNGGKIRYLSQIVIHRALLIILQIFVQNKLRYI